MNKFEKEILIAIAKQTALEEYFADTWLPVSHQKVLMALGTDTKIQVRPVGYAAPRRVENQSARHVESQPTNRVENQPARRVENQPVELVNQPPRPPREPAIATPTNAFEEFVVKSQKPWFWVFNKHPDGIYKKKRVAALAETWYEAVTCVDKDDANARAAFEAYTRGCYSETGNEPINLEYDDEGQYDIREIQEHWYCWCSAIIKTRLDNETA